MWAQRWRSGPCSFSQIYVCIHSLHTLCKLRAVLFTELLVSAVPLFTDLNILRNIGPMKLFCYHCNNSWYSSSWCKNEPRSDQRTTNYRTKGRFVALKPPYSPKYLANATGFFMQDGEAQRMTYSMVGGLV